MAEIEIEKKKTIWPWILLVLLIVAAIIWWIVADDSDEMEATEEITTEEVMEEETYESSDTDETTVMTSIQEYSNYIDNPEMGMDHEYANGALLELIDATRTVAENNKVNINAELEEAQEKAEMIAEDPLDLTHAERIKSSGEIIAQALQTLQTEKFPGLEQEYSAVEEALAQIEAEEPTLDQKEAVKSFFDNAEELLIAMK
ncbi:hypothetical protein E0K83_11090 [Gramella sp. BOM4]|nr:hypothetical protein [Christiangramia bathymodioli]